MSSGSSPLTRGKHGLVFRVGGHPGLIPAHAGKTLSTHDRSTPGWAHPRSRGENALLGTPTPVALGSSPLTRGKHLLRGLNCARPRLIPAHAGKTRGGAVSTFPREAHPRSRGENIRVRFVITNLSGSSPLTRGKQGDSLAAWRRSRLIPAHAGKTISEHANSDPAQAHPRSRGENPSSTMTSGVGSGSSPLTRGKQAIVALDCHPCRLIPAHAGKTSRGGEKAGGGGGLIPAHAGKTGSRARRA